MRKRELQILALLHRGENVKTIAGSLGLSPFTVYGYLATLRRLYQVRTTAELVRVTLAGSLTT